MLVNSVFLETNQQQQFFYCILPAFSLILTETLAECLLIQLSFCDSFFFGAEIYEVAFRKNKPSQNFQKPATR